MLATNLQIKLKELRLFLGFNNQTSFAEKLGVSQAAIANMESGKREVSKSILLKIREIFDIDLISWDKEAKQNTYSDNIVAIPVYDISAAAGKGTPLIDDEPTKDIRYFDKRVLKHLLRVDDYSNLHIIYAQGDSMDSGWNQPDDIKDGDFLIVDTAQISGNNQIFVILVNNSELRVKRLFKKGDALFISSNNPKYKDEVYYPDNSDVEIKVIGKVVWNGSKENL